MPRIVKFGPQFGKPKGPRMPSMKARAPKMAGGSMAKMKFASGGPTDQGSANEVRFPKGLQKTAQEMLEQAKKEKREANVIKAPAKASGMKKGGSVGSASKRADGCAMKGKTKGRFV